MKKNSLKDLDLNIYEEELDNGLKVYLVPMDNVNSYEILYFTRYGSKNYKYFKHNKIQETPLGVAHFLEHKLFEQSSGEDVFTHFARHSSQVNAFTTDDITCYLCEGTKDYKEDLKYLLSFVNAPYFTEQNIEKEQGIIAEEIKARLDNHYIKLIETSLKGVFKYSGYTEPVSGSISSIKKITPKILYDCYNTFYVPNNMYIVMTGSFNEEEASKIIHKVMDPIKRSEDVINEEINEDDKVVKEKEIIKGNVEVNKCIYTIKINTDKFNYDNLYKLYAYLDLFIDSLFSKTSDFYIDNYEKNNFKFFESFSETKDNFYSLKLGFDSNKTDIVLKEIDKVFKNIPNKETFERKKKVYIANIISGSTNEKRIADSLLNKIRLFNHPIYDEINEIRSLKYNEFLDIIKQIDFNNKNICILEKNI